MTQFRHAYVTHIPEPLLPLYELALDLRRSSSFRANELWSIIDPVLWSTTHNPWILLQVVPEHRLDKLAKDQKFLDLLKVHTDFRQKNMQSEGWFQSDHKESPLTKVAYFSMEYGLSESLPIYSGGLGMLAGDHLKSASDLGIPLVAIGLLYQVGYFRQGIDAEGRQKELYPYNEPSQLPIHPAFDSRGQWIRVPMQMRGRILWLRAWQVQVGKINLFLLDSNDLLNSPTDRGITSELYGGDEELRLQQEIILGVGGWKLLEILDIRPEICHLNEGHAGFVILARIENYMKRKEAGFKAALEATKKGNLFTTHTPVAAGFDRYDPGLIEQYLAPILSHFGIQIKDFLALGRANPNDDSEKFNMAYFAIRGTGAANAVSELHGKVSQKLFQPLFPDQPEDKVPVGFVTNGIHVPSWEGRASDELWSEACGEGRWFGKWENLQQGLNKLPDERLWAVRSTNRKRLIEYASHRYADHLEQTGVDEEKVGKVLSSWKSEILTLGLARRFATYKRANLLLSHPDKFLEILNNREQPVQLIIAGKAHPQDEPGKELIHQWIDFIHTNDLHDRLIFLKDYDIMVADHLVNGVDVWINTPRRPFEASGTSGMKILANGGINLSELDGWWAEAYQAEVGWALGDGNEHGDDPSWDEKEAQDLYRILKEEVIPLFYNRNGKNIPEGWVKKMRESMGRLTGRFSTNRMAKEYTEKYYIPLAKNLKE